MYVWLGKKIQDIKDIELLTSKSMATLAPPAVNNVGQYATAEKRLEIQLTKSGRNLITEVG